MFLIPHNFTRIAMNKKRLFLVLFTVCCSLLSSYAQQRSVQSIDSIVEKHCRLRGGIQSRYLKTKSSSIVQDDYLLSGKEAFYIYTSTSSNKSSFFIVSGDEKLPAILAYSDSCAFDVNNIPPAVKYWLQTYVVQLKNDQALSDRQFKRLNVECKEEGVSPLLQKIQWGQASPYNDLCPTIRKEKTLTGCVATAMAQIMRYYSYPAVAKGYADYYTTTNNLHITHDFSADIFDWNNMVESYSSSYSEKQANAISVLMASCGASVKMDYGTSEQGGSGAYQSDLLNGYITNYGYDNDAALVIRNYCSTEAWHRLLVEELNNGRPVNYAGANMRDGGHSFVIDGYRIGNNIYPDYHVNWGWEGSCDGYYQIANLHPQEWDSNATIAAFSESQQMTIGVKPEDGISNSTQLLLSSKVSSSLSTVKAGSSLTFSVASMYNCSYKKFAGIISVALKGEDGILYPLSDGNNRQLNYLEGTGNLNIICTIPNTIEIGKYQSCLVYKTSNSEAWNEVYASSTPIIEVTENKEGGDAIEEWPEIGCSDLELLKGNEQYMILANVYEVENLQTEPFEGRIFFTITDEGGSPLFSFGESTYISELGYMDFLTIPIEIVGSINRDIPDGQYRLYISAQKRNQKTSSLVVLKDTDIPEAPTKELYYRVIVKKGIAYIDDKEYEILPTNIDNIQLLQNSKSSYYTLDGRKIYRLESLPKGIYVMQQDGKTKKIYR